jgi:hypothetical protein
MCIFARAEYTALWGSVLQRLLSGDRLFNWRMAGRNGIGGETMLKVGDANTKVIPGHGPLATKDDLRRTHEMLSTVYGRLAPMAKQGKSVEEVAAAAPTKDYDEKWGKGLMPPPAWVKVAYTSILRHNQKA